jgi:hypothetical protein
VGAWGKENPEMFSNLPSIFASPKWAAAPAVLFVLATIIFIVRLYAAEPQSTSRSPPQVVDVQRLIKDPRLDWDVSGRLSLQGRFTRPGGPISVYVTYATTTGSTFARRPNTVLGGGGITGEPRIKVDSLSHFDREEKTDITLGFVTEDNGKLLQWGQPQQNKTKIGITFGTYLGAVILVWNEGKNEEAYPFAIVATFEKTDRPGAQQPPPIMIGPDAFFLIERIK